MPGSKRGRARRPGQSREETRHGDALAYWPEQMPPSPHHSTSVERGADYPSPDPSRSLAYKLHAHLLSFLAQLKNSVVPQPRLPGGSG